MHTASDNGIMLEAAACKYTIRDEKEQKHKLLIKLMCMRHVGDYRVNIIASYSDKNYLCVKNLTSS